MKTMVGWDKSNAQSLTDYCNVGDEVAEGIIIYFSKVLPPMKLNKHYLQVGEPYSHITDSKTGNEKATYITFAKENDKWLYKGTCFINETEHQTE